MAPITRHPTPRTWFVPVRARTQQEAAPAMGRRRWWLGLALLAGYLLFCHGCHGDEDNELFVGGRNQAVMRTSAVP
ncbi:MAG TPA: hypothetical protein VKA46_25010 [Gemmataceae bacterium]|nr:hypothetical protein [Gemmataceae bacterium]